VWIISACDFAAAQAGAEFGVVRPADCFTSRACAYQAW